MIFIFVYSDSIGSICGLSVSAVLSDDCCNTDDKCYYSQPLHTICRLLHTTVWTVFISVQGTALFFSHDRKSLCLPDKIKEVSCDILK